MKNIENHDVFIEEYIRVTFLFLILLELERTCGQLGHLPYLIFFRLISVVLSVAVFICIKLIRRIKIH